MYFLKNESTDVRNIGKAHIGYKICQAAAYPYSSKTTG